MNKFLLFYFLIIFSRAVQFEPLNGKPLYRKGYAGQTLELNNAFTRQFKIKVSPQNDSSFIEFEPNRLKLIQIQKHNLGNKNLSILQALRTPYVQQFRQLLVHNNLIYILKDFRTVQIIQQVGKDFIRDQFFTINQIPQQILFSRLYKYKNNVLLFADDKVYQITKHGTYNIYDFPVRYFSHVQWLEGTDYLFISSFGEGFGVFEIKQDKKLEKIAGIGKKQLNLTQISIEDVCIRNIHNNKIYILERLTGVHELIYDPKNITNIKYSKLLIPHPGCYSLDTLEDQYFVLSCSTETSNYLVQVIIKQNQQPHILRPLFKNTYVYDIEVAPDYFLSLSRKAIHVYWNSIKQHIPQQFRFGNDLIIDSIQAIQLVHSDSKQYLYVISSNNLHKYLVDEIPPKIKFYSPKPISKQLEITLYGSCQSINKQLVQKKIDEKYEFCSYNSQYTIQIVEPNKTQKSDISASMSIIIILLVVLLILIWICLKKYKKLEYEARRMLQEYKAKRQRNRFDL